MGTNLHNAFSKLQLQSRKAREAPCSKRFVAAFTMCLQPPAAVPQSCRITHTPLARSCANAFRHLQLQSRIAGASRQLNNMHNRDDSAVCALQFLDTFLRNGLSLQSRAVLGDSFTQIEHSWKTQTLPSATRGATLPVKAQGLAPHFHGFPSEPTHSQTVTVIFCYHWLTWRKDWPWTFVRNSEVYKLPFDITP